MDKKAIRCSFVGYDSQRKGWHCCDPSTGKCYTSPNVIFDEASSWWSSNNEMLPDSNVLKDVLDSSHIQLSLDEAEAEANEDTVEEGVTQNPWQTGLYQQPSEDELNGENTPPSLRRSSRIKKLNPKYANAAILEEENEKEPKSFEEAF
ncbi:hypothetical protein KY285_026843 [Solanum tuberosum]|nr:hypothetical protein KY285_026843 [Solanum tuberosum]